MNKQELREKIIAKRKTINTEEISGQIVENIRRLAAYKTAQNVMLFYPMKYEINLLNLLNDKKNFFLPKIDGDNLLICPFSQTNKLEISDFNTKEPQTTPAEPDDIDLIFVPALCVDLDNNRLGYGKGYFDRLLKDFNGISIVPISEQFVFDTIPTEDFDVPVDIVITENY
ncbi:5-formyltetrahydrofolate cyclo-ligase [bacterium]|nr:5-formyltetrahydrofolate cyclo-ligase [bacterium]